RARAGHRVPRPGVRQPAESGPGPEGRRVRQHAVLARGALALFPKLAPIGTLAGLYSVWLFALGVPIVMKAPRDRAVTYLVLVSVGGILIGLLMGALPQLFVGR